MSVVQVNKENGDPLTKIVAGETVDVALQRLKRFGTGALENKNGVALLDTELITEEGAPYVFKRQEQQGPNKQGAPAPDQETPDITSVVKDKLKKWDGTATLEDFTIDEDAAFRSYWKEENSVPVPALPVNVDKPSLLLHDLNNPDHNKISKGYKYIDGSQGVGPISLYGTSGAGKTRTIFEYLSCNYGLYLSAGADDLQNPGSSDVKYMISQIELKINYLSNSDPDRKRKSEENLISVHVLLELLVCVRQAVFDHVDAVLKAKRGQQKGITCYEWLLIQLFPKKFLTCDVFRDVMVELTGKGEVTYQSGFMGEMSCFLDEAQVLVKTLKGFFLSSDGNEEQSAYYAFLRGLVQIHDSGKLHYPCFSGTGLSIEAYKAEAKSLMNKPNFKDHSFFFFGLKSFTATEVVEYIKKFLNLDKVADDLVRHVGEWLKGRPRWTATFVETYIERVQTTSKREPRGKFKDEEIPLIKSLNRYIEICTVTEKEQRNTRLSWSLGDRSAGKAINNMFTKTGVEWASAQQEFRKSTFEFSLRGRVVNMTKQSVEMIEAGVASVYIDGDKTESSDSKYIQAYICEPIIIQASLNFFGLRDYTTEKLVWATSDSEKGNLFEEYLLPSMQHRFKKIMKAQLGQQLGEEFLKTYSLPSCSSYGVLARRCDDASDTIKWINDTLDSRFEGIVAPFCFADTLFGPDLLTFLRTTNWELFRFLAIQAKLRYNLSEADALRTIVPELFYKENRSTKKSCALKHDRGLQEDWKRAEEKLFCMEKSEEVSTAKTRSKKDKIITVRKRKRDMIRVLVQHPKMVSVEPGPVPACEYKPGRNPKDKLNDYLMTIDANNATTFFGSAGSDVLELVKPSGHNKERKR